MRIISGSLKKKSIKFLKNLNTRPLKDSVKENIFNILLHSNLFNVDIKDASILDLYSGIGSFGIECISRGAKKVVFIEKDKNAIKILKSNLLKLAIAEKAEVFNDNIENTLKTIRFSKFSIFFLDPPFNSNKYIENLELIKKKKLFKKNHIIILHREKKSFENLEKFFKILKTKNYGRSKVIFGCIN